MLQLQRISRDVLREKYAKGDERTAEDVHARVANGLAEVERDRRDVWQRTFQRALQAGLVMAGRVSAAAGTATKVTWINCFVQPVADCISAQDEHGLPGIYEALREATETLRRGGGVGYDFSKIRPRGALVKGTGSSASGPVSYMRVFDRSCETVESAGVRRGAQMGILRVDHPDIREFIQAKDTAGELTNFNLSVGVTDAFMAAVREDTEFDLVHAVRPSQRRSLQGVTQRVDGLWVYDRVNARALFELITRSTYDHGEPGIFFLDRVAAENNLAYCERIEACNPCAEQPLPSYGCCCLASINLTRFVSHPFEPGASFDFEGFAKVARTGVRMLDNVLDGTMWPLQAQREEAMNKRRIGLGFLGLGSTLVMLGLHYDSTEGRAFGARVAEVLRDASYEASIELAKERGAFPLFDAEKYLASGFASRLPKSIRRGIKLHGLRNSHLNSIAPTGTISLAFGDNASNGIEPPFAWVAERRKRAIDGGWESYPVMDHAFRLWTDREENRGKDPEEIQKTLPAFFRSALEISADAHSRMVTDVQPYVDSAISKTVNVPADYPFEQFQDLYMRAWERGAKSLATFRPNDITGTILSAEPSSGTEAAEAHDPDQRIVIAAPPQPALNSLRWPRRPDLPDGNDARCYRVRHPNGQRFALFVGQVPANGAGPDPFEVWVNGAEVPRGLNALAINLSYDMYGSDKGWLQRKLGVLAALKVEGEEFSLPMPPQGKRKYAPSVVAAMAMLLEHRCAELGTFRRGGETPVLDALMSPQRTGPDGTMSWTVEVLNAGTGEDFVLGLKEAAVEIDGTRQRRPYAVFLAGQYPRTYEGLAASLSLDMCVVDPAWISKKLIELLEYREPKGDLWARVPGTERSRSYPSTVAYVARLILHRYTRLGVLDPDGNPLVPMGACVPEWPPDAPAPARTGRVCEHCGSRAVVKADGCDRCTECGEIGHCG